MITKDLEKKLEGLGAFEISSKMLKLAKNNEKHNKFLNYYSKHPSKNYIDIFFILFASFIKSYFNTNP